MLESYGQIQGFGQGILNEFEDCLFGCLYQNKGNICINFKVFVRVLRDRYDFKREDLKGRLI